MFVLYSANVWMFRVTQQRRIKIAHGLKDANQLTWRGRGYPALSRRLRPNHKGPSVLRRGTGDRESVHWEANTRLMHREDLAGHAGLKTEADLQPGQVGNCHTQKGKKTISSLGLPERNSVLPTP